MRELVIATQNQGKLREIRQLLEGLEFKVTSLADYPGHPEIIEDGDSFAANALIKARVIADFTGKLTMGEDSGLEVDALDQAPGIYSARFAGTNATDEDNNRILIQSLKNVPPEQRQARYQCCATLVYQGQQVAVIQESCEGFIAEEPRGTNGFGYDPYFLIEKYDKTFGELDPSIKAEISHRAKTLKRLRTTLENLV